MATPTGSFTLTGDNLPGDVTTVRYEAFEAISTPYEVNVEFFTEDPSYRVDACLRTRMCLMVVNAAEEVRFFDGVVDLAELTRVVWPRFYFRVRLRPALAALEHRENCRIFQEKTIVQVIQQIFTDAGFADKVEWQLTKEYAPRDFIVQYRESDLNFVSRLLEDHGIFYFFAHGEEGHRLILGDDAGVFAPYDDAPTAILTLAQGLSIGSEPLERFTRTRTLRTNAVRLRDYDFEKPQTKPESEVPSTEKWPMPYYDYPGGFTATAAGGVLADARMRSLRRDADVVAGASRAIHLRVGVPFTVEGAAEGCLDGEFIVTELRTRGEQHQDRQQESVACKNAFRGVPVGAPFAPERRARRPKIHGIQTAIVTGSSQQEQALHVDNYGRIKVRFYWDRVGQQDHTSSCWLRVSQVPMGGTMILPRIGWEVSVAFLDGDPDRPLVLGRVYNAEKTPPAALPGAKASGTLKSMSSPGGGGHNEISMSDSAGSQGLSIHAQKDLNITIGHDKKEEIGVDEEHNITVNESSSVGVDESIQIGANQSLDVGSVLSHKIAADQSITVGGNDTSNAIANYVEKVGGNRTYTVGGNQTTISNGIEQSVTGNFSRTVGTASLVGSIASISDNILGAYAQNVGAVTVHLVNGGHSETIAQNKDQTSLAAELHLTKGDLSYTCGGPVTQMVGGLHYQKIDGDYVIKAPIVAMLGAVGIFKGGSSELKLGGGPIVMKGSTIKIESAMIVKMGASLKMGS